MKSQFGNGKSKFNALREISERHASNDEYENLLEATAYQPSQKLNVEFPRSHKQSQKPG